MIDHFDIFAPFYDRVIPPVDPEIYRVLLDLPVRGLMLDAGGGTGRVSVPLRPWVRRLVVADASRAMLERAGRKGGNWAVRSKVETLPFPDGTFQRILVADAFHHFHCQQAALEELVRVLAPGGLMLLEEPDITRPVIRVLALLEKLAMMRSRILSAETIAGMVNRDGLSWRIIRDGRWLAWVVILKKDIP